jgi:hypothetical protein
MKKMYLDIETIPADGERIEILRKLWGENKKNTRISF